MDNLNNYNVIRYRYERGVLTIEEMMGFVEKNIINKEQFHQITTYSYDGLKESKNNKKG